MTADATAADRLIHPVILSGGSGTRLWPLSRRLYPKQLMALTGERSLLRETVARAGDPRRFAPPLVVCNEAHRFLVARELREQAVAGASIVLEPCGRNTAPAVAVAAAILAEEDAEALMLIMPSDHYIAEPEAFRAAIERGRPAAEAGWLVTFGITPDRPDSAYGYIEQGTALAGLEGCHAVARFVEKPDRATAESYLARGGSAWNSGLFLASAGRWLEELERHAPAVVAAARAALESAAADLDFLRLGAEAFAAAPSISIDYAVMEHAERAAVVPASMGWSDVGSWDALWAVGADRGSGNRVSGDVVALDCRDSYLRGDGPLVAAVGLEAMIAVSTKDAVLIAPRGRAQEVKDLVGRLEAEQRREPRHHTRVFRPWGSYEGIDAGEGFQVKRLIVEPGASISLQRHRQRAEHWVVVRGTAEVTRDGEVFTLSEMQSINIPQGAVHRLRNPAEQPLHVVEVQTGGYLGEDDIERFEDLYGRPLARPEGSDPAGGT